VEIGAVRSIILRSLVRRLRNNRIRLVPFLAQHCALSDDFEPMLLAQKHWSFSAKILVAIDGNDLACCDHQSQYDGKGFKVLILRWKQFPMGIDEQLLMLGNDDRSSPAIYSGIYERR
jgi:hypothetical protein